MILWRRSAKKRLRNPRRRQRGAAAKRSGSTCLSAQAECARGAARPRRSRKQAASLIWSRITLVGWRTAARTIQDGWSPSAPTVTGEPITPPTQRNTIKSEKAGEARIYRSSTGEDQSGYLPSRSWPQLFYGSLPCDLQTCPKPLEELIQFRDRLRSPKRHDFRPCCTPGEPVR